MIDAKFAAILLLSMLFGYEANWSSVFCALTGGIVAVVYFWKLLKAHKSLLGLLIGFTVFLMLVNIVGATNWLNNVFVLIAPAVAMFLIQSKFQGKPVAV